MAGGAEQSREWMEREVARELERAQARRTGSTASKAKNETFDMEVLEGRLSDEGRPRPRVNAEGELTDSFVEEARRGEKGRR